LVPHIKMWQNMYRIITKCTKWSQNNTKSR
jgi:hypothetical protein